MIREREFCREQAWELCSTKLSCVILPQYGGKVASICSRETGFELLFQNPRDGYRKALPGSLFEAFEACGFDDAFPSIDSGKVVMGGKAVAYPDHGEIWSACFDSQIRGESLCLEYKSVLLGYLYEKKFRLEGDALVCSYVITNLGTRAFPYIWACHCLVAFMPDMKLIYPDGIKEIEVVLDSEILGSAGTVHPYAAASAGKYDFNGVRGGSPAGMEKYYVRGAVPEGSCGYRYPAAGMAADLSYDAKKLPYLGFWISAGGFRGDWNCAFEPASGYYDSIERAGINNSLSVLKPGEKFSFELKIRLYPWKQEEHVKGEKKDEMRGNERGGKGA